VSVERGYPLQALLELRSSELDEAKARLAEAQRHLAAREAATAAARAALEAHRRTTAELLAAFAAERGPTSPAELGRRDAYRRRREDERQALTEAWTASEADERSARGAVDGAQAGLAEARARLEAVEKDAARHRLARERRAEAKEESEIEDLLGARRRR
jgi:colicin import membrane protein